MRPHPPRRPPAPDRRRGATLLESALALPVVVGLVLGVLEFGVALQTDHSLGDLGAGAAREVAIWGDEPLADRALLDEVNDHLGSIDRQSIDHIVVFRSVDAAGDPSPSGTMPPGCAFASIDDVCNRYTVADLDRPDTDFGCGLGTVDDAWCPSDRQADIDSGPIDYAGIHIAYTHDMITGLYGETITFERDTVARLEPRRPE